MTAPPRNAAAGPPGPPAATAVVEAYFEAVDAEDFDKLSRLLDSDVSLTACGSPLRIMPLFTKMQVRRSPTAR